MVDRREFLRQSAVMLFVALANPSGLSAQTSAQELELYFPQTGHHLSGRFLDFWRKNRNGNVFGYPITEPLKNSDGLDIQYFQNVRLEDSVSGGIKLGSLGQELFPSSRPQGPVIEEHPRTYQVPNQQIARTTDLVPEFPHKFAWFDRKYPADFGRLMFISSQERSLVLCTDKVFMVDHPDVMPMFYQRWRDERDLHVLWPQEVTLKPLGQMAVEKNDVDKLGVAQRLGSLTYSSRNFDNSKRIDVNLTNQRLEATEGGFLVLGTPVSTGKPGYETPRGNFRVNLKAAEIDYLSPFPEAPYFQPRVPFNMRFFGEAYIHGAYWHDEFGVRIGYGRSYGCVNIDLDEASWLYGWAPTGTLVTVHE